MEPFKSFGRQFCAKLTGESDSDAPRWPDAGESRLVNPGRVAPAYTQSQLVTLDYPCIARHRCIGLLGEAPELDVYKVLRSQIGRKMNAKGWSTLMITSIHPGEGKTITAINLSAMFALEYQRTVLLVDLDLQHQSIHKMLGYQHDKGVVDHLLDGDPIKDIIVWPQVEKLTLISGGRTIHESSELLGSDQMAAFVDEIKNRYPDRLIIFDMPPLFGPADTMTFAPLADAMAIVVSNGKTPLPDIQTALEKIPREKIIGFIMNHQP